MEKSEQNLIIIKKKKGRGHGHHGGSWKVAFADFMTAMMAFFLLLWLLETTTEEQQVAIAGYFKDPSSRYVIGPGGADSAVIDLEISPPSERTEDPTLVIDEQITEAMRQLEQQQLEQLKLELEKELDKADSVFNLLKDQILIDSTPLGLRIQIVDAEHRPMFDVGSAKMKSYSAEVLQALAELLNNVPNKLSVTGHTDAMPYSEGALYGNWELSTDRANSARRELHKGQLPEAKIATVQGMGAVAPLRPEDPHDPINRRIAIIVLKKDVADAFAAGDGGLPSSELLKIPTPPTIMSDAEVEAAIEAEAKK
jgi:chemotaxis protein MotB